MTGFASFAYVEAKLFFREKIAMLAVFGLPVALVIGFGQIPGFGTPSKSLSGQIGTEYIASVAIAIALATICLNGVPMAVGQYRERGILRRLAVTPVSPLTLLAAKLAVYAASGILSVVIVAAVSRFAYHVPLPRQPGWFALSVVLGVAALLGLGMLVAAVAPTARAATGIGFVLFFPNLFLAGVYFPSDEMSPALQRAGNLTPLGSALHAIRDSWMGYEPRTEYLIIMAVYAVVAATGAALFFRWESS
jgi:ABC-2 type transport system permease protein